MDGLTLPHALRQKREEEMKTTDRSQVAEIAAQIGSSVMPDNAVWTNRFAIKSTSSSSVYTVAQRRTDGVWGCSCRGWTHHRHCKHLTDILSRLAALPVESLAVDPAVQEMLTSARTAYLDLDVIPLATRQRTVGRVLDL